MDWKDLLSSGPEEVTLPWAGGRRLTDGKRSWKIRGKLPREHGWYIFTIDGGRTATIGKIDEYGPDEELFTRNRCPILTGYLAGSRFIADNARVDPDPENLIDQTEQAYLIEPGLDRFTRAVVLRLDDRLYYLRQEFPQGPEFEVQAAYQDRLESVDHVKGVTPALDLCFRWESQQRLKAEEWEREMERLRLEELAKAEAEERLRQAMKDAGTAAGRRELAKRDFKLAAKTALAVSGAELLDVLPGAHATEMRVQYRVQGRRLECVCHRDTLRIIDAGVCLDNHRGTKGDTRFTLESLPSVIQEAIRDRKLVVWRHVAGDPGYDRGGYDDDDYDDW